MGPHPFFVIFVSRCVIGFTNALTTVMIDHAANKIAQGLPMI